MAEETTLTEVYRRCSEGTFYDDHDWASGPALRCLRQLGDAAADAKLAAEEWRMGGDLTLRELQVNLPWSIRYSTDFRSSPITHKDFAHALLHVHKAGGKLAAVCDDMDHDRSVADSGADLAASVTPYIADLVICALRMANTLPGGPVDLQRAVQHRLETKNDTTLPEPGRNRPAFVIDTTAAPLFGHGGNDPI